ncbi:MAG: hypothetical protein HZA07_07040 [Nitrospirae bacterium]|nr:hypothetical protein [Nitrospirota bacterium]
MIRVFSIITSIVLLYVSLSLNLCAFNSIKENNETTLVIDVCKDNISIVTPSVDKAIVQEEFILFIPEEHGIPYRLVISIIKNYIPDPPDKPPRV